MAHPSVLCSSPCRTRTCLQQAPIVASGEDGLHLVFGGSSEDEDVAWYSADGAAAVRLGDEAFPSVDGTGTAVWDSLEGLRIGTPASNVVIAAGVGGSIDQGFITWFEPVSGLRNRLVVATEDGRDEVDLGTDDAPPYARNLVRLTDELVFTAWQEGTNPEFGLRGAFVRP